VFVVSRTGARHPARLGAIGIVVLLAIGLLVYFSGDLPFIGGGTTYTADFTESGGLVGGDEVRIAGVKVGTVSRVSLAGNHVRVAFRVKNAWIGDASTAAIKIKTLLGDKYLSVDPLGVHDQNPGRDIPTGRTVAPYDVQQALGDLSDTVGQIDTKQLAQSFEAIAGTFANTPPQLHAALTGLASLSETIASRDNQLAELLANTKQLTGALADDDTQFQRLLTDGNQLLAELQQRRDVIESLLTGTQALATQLSGLVADDSAAIGPTLTELDQVTDVLQRNEGNLNKALALAGPYYRLVGNTLGNGRWLDAYVCGLIPAADVPAGTEPSSGCQSPRNLGGN
jgi:phospholipid/cholesterol/gamma-HCH transport system substrate-binding protein